MTKEEVLQKVNDYCTEKQYTTATLTDAFKKKFSEHFFKANEAADINDETVVANLKFALNSAFSGASELATLKTQEFGVKENTLKNEIEELKKKLGQPTPPPTPPPFEIPKELQDQIDELKQFKEEKNRKEKVENILKIAKADIREDLHSSFDAFAENLTIEDGKDEKTIAEDWVAKYKKVFGNTVVVTKPMKPTQTQKDVQEFVDSLPQIKVKQ